MTKHSIEVSKEIRDEYVRLKGEIKKLGGQEISDDDVLAAMIGGFFDSLEYMKEHKREHGHHHHDDGGCCGGKGGCEDCDCEK